MKGFLRKYLKFILLIFLISLTICGISMADYKTTGEARIAYDLIRNSNVYAYGYADMYDDSVIVTQDGQKLKVYKLINTGYTYIYGNSTNYKNLYVSSYFTKYKKDQDLSNNYDTKYRNYKTNYLKIYKNNSTLVTFNSIRDISNMAKSNPTELMKIPADALIYSDSENEANAASSTDLTSYLNVTLKRTSSVTTNHADISASDPEWLISTSGTTYIMCQCDLKTMLVKIGEKLTSLDNDKFVRALYYGFLNASDLDSIMNDSARGKSWLNFLQSRIY